METKLTNAHLRALSKLSLLFVLAFSLSACLEVKDDSNDDVVSSLNAQNAILQAQLEQQKAAQAEMADAAPIIIMGTVFNLATSAPVAAKLTLNIGDASREPVTSSDGSFEFAQVPPGSNYELIIESTDNSFLSRAFYGITRGAMGSSKIFQDLGLMDVSPGKVYSFKVTNDETNASVDTLVFRGRSDFGSSSRSMLRSPHQSIYDKDTKAYLIVLPSEFTVLLEASVDSDDNGAADFTASSPASVSGINLRLVSSAITKDLDIQLEPAGGDGGPLTREYEFRLSVLDGNLDALPNVVITVDDALNGELTASFDETAAQHVFNAKVSVTSRLDVVIPAFSAGDDEYQSSSVSFTLREISELLSLSVSLSNTAANGDTFYRLDGSKKRVDIVMPLRKLQQRSELELVLRSEIVKAPTYSFKAFYSSPIALLEDSASLVQQNVVTVVKGNASPDDAVLPGLTVISRSNVKVGVNTELKIANTALTLTPKAALAPDFSYRYEVGTVKDTLADVEKDLSRDQADFLVPLTGGFDINQLVLDNRNWTTNGAVIVATNTAGSAATARNDRNYPYLYFPRSLSTLKSLVLTKISVLNGNRTQVTNDVYNIVQDGQVRISTVYTAALAKNENIIRQNFFTIETGTSLVDGSYYYMSINEYGSDHTSTNAFQVTFTYAYVTGSDEIKTGTFTLNVK